jgi:hypothetical protein
VIALGIASRYNDPRIHEASLIHHRVSSITTGIMSSVVAIAMNRVTRRAISLVKPAGAGASAIRGLDMITAYANAANPYNAINPRRDEGASSHCRCQSAINGSKTRETVAGSNQRDANASARDVIAITLLQSTVPAAR